MKKFKLNGIVVTSATMEELKNSFGLMMLQHRSNLVLSYNLDCLRNAQKNKSYFEISGRSDLILPDGIGVTSLIWLKYGEKVKRINGSDLFSLLLAIANEGNLKIALVGSSNNVLTTMRSLISEHYSSIEIVTAVSPPFNSYPGDEINMQIAIQVQSTRPDILFAALGNPKQEIWLDHYKDMIGARINVGVGAVFDFFAGEKRRAPKFFQRAGIEWIWRLLLEPKRLYKRYLVHDVPFYFQQILKIRKAKKVNKL